ncbi:hypothetical protein [Acinetobacter puyangensis]|uniref:hypothetical protein n=1 Tax=Acinetobacter puyangensis TaxID=1096779 RepID=UPI003A4D4880
MNAQAQFLTITPEQLKGFEWKKENLAECFESSTAILSQLSTLFAVIIELAKNANIELAKNDNYVDLCRIKNLAELGQYVGDDWIAVMESITKDLRQLSPLESTKA